MNHINTFLNQEIPSSNASAEFTIQVKGNPDISKITQQFQSIFPDVEINVSSVFESKDENLSRWFIATLSGVSLANSQSNPFDICYEILDLLNLESIEPLIADYDFSANFETQTEFNEEYSENEDAEWHLKNLRIPEAWKLAKGQDVLIGQPDLGYAEHNLLASAVRREKGFNMIEEGEWPDDPMNIPFISGHGVAMASTAVSRGQNADKVIHGAAPEAKVLIVRAINIVYILSPRFVRTLARGIEKAVAEEVGVISLSLGVAFWLDNSLVEAAIEYGRKEGVIFVAAAGNYIRRIVYPARSIYCTCVGGSNANDKFWDGSARGKELDICAPADNISTAYRERGDSRRLDRKTRVGKSKGTSYATALVGGLAALWISKHGRDKLLKKYGENMTLAFQKVIRDTARKPEKWDTEKWGQGIADAEALVKAPLPELESISLEDIKESERNQLREQIQKEWDNQVHLSNEELDKYMCELNFHLAYKEYERNAPSKMSREECPPLSNQLREKMNIKH